MIKINMENYKECFIAKFEGCMYIIPQEERDMFDSTPYYDREKSFGEYILPDDAILDSVHVDNYDLQCLIDGDLG